MKRLIGYADTEGTGFGTSELWDASFVFKHIVDDEKHLEDVFHVTHLSISKKAEKSDVKDSLKSYFNTIEYIKDMHECDSVHVGFWHAGHDMSVFKRYGVKSPFEPFDLLTLARRKKKDEISSFNIGNLCDHYNITVEQKVHTGLGDVLRMTKLLPRLDIHINDQIVIINEKLKTKNKPQKDVVKKEIRVSRQLSKPGIKKSATCKNNLSGLAINLARKLKV